MNATITAALERILAAEIPDTEIGGEVSDPAGGYGRELVCTFDCTDAFATTADPRALILQAQLRRLITPRGTLPAHDDDDYGFDVRSMLHAALTQSELRSLQIKIVGELKKDPRVDTVTVRVVYAANRLTITGVTTPRDPRLEPFPFTMTIDRAAATVGAGVTPL